MRDRKVAVRYARALLTSLSDPASREKAEEFLLALGDAMERSVDLRDSLLNPAIPRSTRKTVLDSLADRHGAPTEVKSFLDVVLANGRMGAVPSIARVFREERERAEGIVRVSVESARSMPQEQADRAKSALERLTGKRVHMSIAVNPSLIGGAVTRVGSMVYDGSLKTQLDVLRRRINEEA